MEKIPQDLKKIIEKNNFVYCIEYNAEYKRNIIYFSKCKQENEIIKDFCIWNDEYSKNNLNYLIKVLTLYDRFKLYDEFETINEDNYFDVLYKTSRDSLGL